MKYLTAERQLVGDLPLEQPSEEPIVFVTGAFAVIDPVPTTAIGCPVSKAFLYPKRKELPNMTGPEPSLLPRWVVSRSEGADLRPPAVLVLIDERYFRPSSVSPRPKYVFVPVAASKATAGTMMWKCALRRMP